MKKSAGHNAPSAEPRTLETSVFIGQIEQVVSSADCRSAERNETLDRRVSEQIRGRGPAGHSPRGSQSAEPEGYVYFISDGRFVKVGWARDPLSRLGELQTGSSQRLVILGAAEGERQLEGEFHRLFEDGRVRGEWFDPARSDRLAEVVDRLQREAEEIPAIRSGPILIYPERWALFE